MLNRGPRTFAVPESAVIVGAASGMGEAAATVLASCGCVALGLLDVNAAGLPAVAASCEKAGARTATAAVDVRDRAAVHAAFEQIAEELGPPGAVLHFAGVTSHVPFEDVDDDAWTPIVDVNMKGTLWVAQAAVAQLRRSGRGGALVLTGSVSARTGPVLANIAYAASKGGVNAITRTLARRLGPENIRVNAVSPGQTYTPMLEGAWTDGSDLEQENAKTAYEAAVPLGRIGEAHELASAAVFLASPASSYITGEILEVNGGFYFD